MPNPPIKILFFADTHLGFDLPAHPRVQMRRRGDDFFANYQFLLDLALAQKVDMIIHGGDLFHRPRVHPAIIENAYTPLIHVANAGIPIYIVPGNHERAKLPPHLWLTHPNIHLFDQPKTYLQKFNHGSIALSGFPFARKVQQKFSSLLLQTDYHHHQADCHLLCVHQAFEGAQVGPRNFTFRRGPDNIPGERIPRQFSLALSGHIHRSQHLTHALDGKPLTTPIIYPGSIERTSFAERDEEKHYVLLKIDPFFKNPRPQIEFHPLPTRPMRKLEIPTTGLHLPQFDNLIRQKIAPLDPNTILRIQLTGPNAESFERALPAHHLRTLAPPTMNISLAYQWK